MKILIHDYAGHAFPTSLSRALAARGHDVVHAYASCLQTPRGDLQHRPGDAENLEFHEFPMDPNYPRFKYAFRRRRGMEIRYGSVAADFIRQWRPDAVLSGNTPTEPQEAISRATTESGGRFYFWVQDFYSLAVDKLLRKKLPIAGGFIGAWYRLLDSRQFQRSSGIIAISEDFTDTLSHEFGVDATRVSVIPNWAVIEKLPTLPKDNEWARQHALHDKFVFLYSGTLGMKHNPALLLELAKHFRDHSSIEVVVVSEGIGADWLRREAATAGLRQLRVLPYQAFSQFPAVLASGDVLIGILEEDAATFSVPSKTLSYLCAARPLLLAVPEQNLAARITRSQAAGITVSPNDLPSFLAAAERLHASPAECSAHAARARAYAEAHFPIEHIAAAFENILVGQH
ncbi:MAG: glycosyltransferase WbuB [Verrucomicrobia bacterium]|nr:MAG: glycosyltransferase WbuB [Verrucomicrobiota bacterium]TAE88689.1 MAG: glycosyltransferase WbuB [Verrucomicrobiota bacterium]TAF26490.1 MAG: glycosyltransferase WbuB [Verrucomicrobiota bacterium]